MTTTGFDVRAYMRDPRILRPTDPDLATTGVPSAQALDALTYLWAVEATTLGRMRDVLVTPTHAESRITAFLSTWSYEQYWLAETLRTVLAANGRLPQTPVDTALGGLRRTWDDRARPTVDAIGTNLLGAEVVGAHMVTGWLDTAVLTLAYRRLGAADPALGELVGAVVDLKARHLHFYAEEAADRLTRSAIARRIARSAVARWRLPGTRYAGPTPVRAGVLPLFTDPAARAALGEIDRTAAAFPGLTGTRPLRTALGFLDSGLHASTLTSADNAKSPAPITAPRPTSITTSTSPSRPVRTGSFTTAVFGLVAGCNFAGRFLNRATDLQPRPSTAPAAPADNVSDTNHRSTSSGIPRQSAPPCPHPTPR